MQRDLKYSEAMELIRESYALVRGKASTAEDLEKWSLKDSAEGRQVLAAAIISAIMPWPSIDMYL